MIGTTFDQQVGDLNDEQRTALFHPGNVALLAGPGSGKTATLTLKVAKTLAETPAPRGVACLTYSIEAAREFQARLRKIGISTNYRFAASTLHAFCVAKILKPFGHRLPESMKVLVQYEVASDEEMVSARYQALNDVGINEPEKWWSTKLGKYRRLAPFGGDVSGADARMPELATAYRRRLFGMSRIDFDDIIEGALWTLTNDEHVRNIIAAKYAWLIVDEYQDLGLALDKMVRLLAGIGVKIFAVGDPDQAVYGFNGADPGFLRSLAQEPTFRAVTLRRNYRCTQHVVNASLAVLSESRDFVGRSPGAGTDIWLGRCPSGLEQQASVALQIVQQLRGVGIKYGGIAVLGKRWEDVMAMEPVLRGAGIPVRCVRGLNYRRTSLTGVIDDMMVWCAGGDRGGKVRLAGIVDTWRAVESTTFGVSRSRGNMDVWVRLYDLLTSVRQPSIRVGDWIAEVSRILALPSWAAARSRVQVSSRYELAQLALQLQHFGSREVAMQTIAEYAGMDDDRVVLQSLHGSKGLEYDAVIMIAMDQGVIPGYREDHGEARRLMYVGVTRSKRLLYVLWSGFYFQQGRRFDKGESMFVTELRQRIGSGTT